MPPVSPRTDILCFWWTQIAQIVTFWLRAYTFHEPSIKSTQGNAFTGLSICLQCRDNAIPGMAERFLGWHQLVQTKPKQWIYKCWNMWKRNIWQKLILNQANIFANRYCSVQVQKNWPKSLSSTYIVFFLCIMSNSQLGRFQWKGTCLFEDNINTEANRHQAH